MQKLYAKLALTDNEFDAWLESIGLLHSTRTCECGREMKIKAKVGRRYGTWRCNGSGCKKEKVHNNYLILRVLYFRDIWRAHSLLGAIQKQKIFEFTYWWATKQVKQLELMRELGISCQNVVTDWANFCRDICAQFFTEHPIMIGGHGKVNLALFRMGAAEFL